MAKRDRRSCLVFAHLARRSLLAVCLSTIPAAKTLLVFAGLESLLSIDHWHLPTALGAAWTRRVAHLCQGRGTLKEGFFCGDPQLYSWYLACYGFWPTLDSH